MWRNTSRFLISATKKSFGKDMKLYTCSALLKSPLLNQNVPMYSFAKKGEKKLERIAEKQERKEASVEKEIDLKAIEDKMKKEIENFKVKRNKSFTKNLRQLL